MPNPWAGAQDDGDVGNVTVPGAFKMSAADQRQTALTTISGFFRRYLQALDPYKEIFTGRLRPAALVNDQIFWAYQDRERLAVDDFEQRPPDVGHNTLTGPAGGVGFDDVSEAHFFYDNTDYTEPPMLPPTDWRFYHDTLGLKLVWSGLGTYQTELPGGLNVTGFTHLSFRAAKRVTGPIAAGPDVNLFVNVEDGDGDTALWDLRTDQFDRIPHPYERGDGEGNQGLLTGVRIPLRNFTQNNSDVDLDDLHRIVIRVEGAGDIGIDDIEFGN